MDPAVARNIAHQSHARQRNRFGEPIVEHVERVAAAVGIEDRAVAFLHDVLEHSDTPPDELISLGLTVNELAALDLLTRAPGEAYELHPLRIAHATGPPGRLARRVQLADLDDHLGHASLPDNVPPYAWARMHL